VNCFAVGEDLWWDAELIAFPYDKTDFTGREASQIHGRRRYFGRKLSLRNGRRHLIRDDERKEQQIFAFQSLDREVHRIQDR
jgi:hypothetical protein